MHVLDLVSTTTTFISCFNKIPFLLPSYRCCPGMMAIKRALSLFLYSRLGIRNGIHILLKSWFPQVSLWHSGYGTGLAINMSLVRLLAAELSGATLSKLITHDVTCTSVCKLVPAFSWQGSCRSGVALPCVTNISTCRLTAMEQDMSIPASVHLMMGHLYPIILPVGDPA